MVENTGMYQPSHSRGGGFDTPTAHHPINHLGIRPLHAHGFPTGKTSDSTQSLTIGAGCERNHLRIPTGPQ